MPLTYGKVAGNTILAADHNEVGLLLKGQTGSGEAITLIYNAAGVIALQPSSDPAASTQLIQLKNNAGTVKFAIRADGSLVFSDASIQTTAAVAVSAATVSAAGTISANDQKRLTKYAAGNSGAALTIDWANGDVQTVTMTGNCTFTFSNPIDGHFYQLRLLQDGTGSRTATWPATARWSAGTAPTLTTTINKTDYITFYYDSTAVKYDGTFAGNF